MVFVKDFKPHINKDNPQKSYPYILENSNVFWVSIYPDYHTELFPDSKLNTESKFDFVENLPHRNAISKLYVSHSYERIVKKGDILLFYRTGGINRGVVTTIAIIESIIDNISDERQFIKICQRQSRTVLSEAELKNFWNRFPKLKPFVVNLLYTYSLPKRINLRKIIEMGIISSPTEIPRGIWKMKWEDFINIIQASESNESIIVN